MIHDERTLSSLRRGDLLQVRVGLARNKTAIYNTHELFAPDRAEVLRSCAHGEILVFMGEVDPGWDSILVTSGEVVGWMMLEDVEVVSDEG